MSTLVNVSLRNTASFLAEVTVIQNELCIQGLFPFLCTGAAGFGYLVTGGLCHGKPMMSLSDKGFKQKVAKKAGNVVPHGRETLSKHSMTSWQNKTSSRRGLVLEGMWIYGNVPLVHVPLNLHGLQLLKIEQEPGNRCHLSPALRVEIRAQGMGIMME